MENYLLQGNVVKLMPLELPKHEEIAGDTRAILNRSMSILKGYISSECNYDYFIGNIAMSVENKSISILQHRLSPYVDNVMFANENKSSDKDFMVFNALSLRLSSVLNSDKSFSSFILSVGKEFNAKNEIREINVRTVPEADGGYTEFLDFQHLPDELGKLRLFILNNHKKNSLLCAIVASAFLMHIHPLYDGNGRVARVLFNLILGRGKGNYIPLTELCHVGRSGYVLSLREAFLFSEWEPIIVFYCKCIEIVHLKHIN
ncbi:Fic family protein [Serratia quinivorans]|uniref:Fic family protein n=1 Tax=Serratia quinivorans TaxID=137545 RepID=UPI002178597D|nr:Fic family protein [Serratia quinivorans]CAI0852536.1 Fic/DOC family [Serratia quinivorans]